MSYPAYKFSRSHKHWKRAAAASDLTLNNTAWTALPTVTAHTLAVEVGDVIVANISGTFGNEAVDAFLDVHTGTNYFASAGDAAGEGIPGALGLSGALGRFNVFAPYTVVAGDITSGAVTLTVRYRTSTATNKTLYGSVARPLFFLVDNIGPVDPN